MALVAARRRLYAEGTSVEPSASQAEIMGIISRYGANGFGFMQQQTPDGMVAAIMFSAHDRNVRFVLPLPAPDDKAFFRDGADRIRTPAARQNAYEAEVRRRWRALALAIKAKLEVVESDIASFEDEFLAHIVLPDGSTVGDSVRGRVDEVYRKGLVRPLLELESGNGASA